MQRTVWRVRHPKVFVRRSTYRSRLHVQTPCRIGCNPVFLASLAVCSRAACRTYFDIRYSRRRC